MAYVYTQSSTTRDVLCRGTQGTQPKIFMDGPTKYGSLKVVQMLSYIVPVKHLLVCSKASDHFVFFTGLRCVIYFMYNTIFDRLMRTYSKTATKVRLHTCKLLYRKQITRPYDCKMTNMLNARHFLL